jgi:hypothetical protein
MQATIGGGWTNTASDDRATVGGGFSNLASASYSMVGGGYNNTASGNRATVGGGGDNTASATYSTVGGGSTNITSGYAATVGGGMANTASGLGAFVGGGGWDGSTVAGNLASGNSSVIGGGLSNTAGGFAASVAGGFHNVVTATAPYGAIGGGQNNTVSDDYATVGGGLNNTASGQDALVSGGAYNTASGFAATVAGGYGNIASGGFSFAAGADARAIHNGAFVWADQLAIAISSTVANQFLVRATGGISMTTNAAGTTGCSLTAGTWNCTSDRNAKANFAAVDNVAVLDALMTIPIQTWNFNTQDAGIQHMGPTAQDFYAAYGLGEGELTISTVDADGVALAAIQGLYTVVQEKDAQIAALEARVAALETGGLAENAPAPAPATNTLQLLVVLVLGLVAGGGLTLAAFALGKRQAAAVKA